MRTTRLPLHALLMLAASGALTACPADDKTPTTGPSDPAGSEPPEPEPKGETGAAVEPEKPAK